MMFKQSKFLRSRKFLLGIGLALVFVIVSVLILLNSRTYSYSSEGGPGVLVYKSVITGTPQPRINGGPAPVQAMRPSGGATSSGKDMAENSTQPEAMPGAAYASSPTELGKNTSASPAQPMPQDRKIIRNANVSLSADDVERTLLEVRSLSIEKNGLVFQSTSSQKAGQAYANITIQVPAANFDETLNRLRKLTGVKIDSENTTSQDVTEEFVDVQSQLKSLRATEAELTRLLTKATTVAEVLTVQRELNTVLSEIDRREGRLNFINKKSELSTIVITIVPVIAVKPVVATGWDPMQTVETAWAGSVKGLQGVFGLAVTFLVWGIWLIPIAGLLFFASRRAYKRVAPKPVIGFPAVKSDEVQEKV